MQSNTIGRNGDGGSCGGGGGSCGGSCDVGGGSCGSNKCVMYHDGNNKQPCGKGTQTILAHLLASYSDATLPHSARYVMCVGARTREQCGARKLHVLTCVIATPLYDVREHNNLL